MDKLGMAGMSLDESQVEADGRAYYAVKQRAWRSRAVLARLKFIDSQMNKTNAYGGIRPGNAPRKRVRIQGALSSDRDPPTGCPQNYYSCEFLSNLSNRAYNALEMKEKKDLGTVSGAIN